MSEPNGNLWTASARETLSASPLRAAESCDLAIVGGGYTGCSAALHAAEAGLSVRLLEAQRIGHGGSGRNVGLVNAGLWLTLEEVERVLGPEAGERLSTALAAAPEFVFSLIERFAIDCAPVRNGTLHLAETRGGLRNLQDRHRQLCAQGAPVSLLSAEEARARTGSQLFLGALHDARAGTIQPLDYCLGLARAAQAAGAVLHECSPATRIERNGELWRIETTDGAVTAPKLLLATNAYHHDAIGAPRPQSIPVSYFQLATAPLPLDLRASILPGGEGCWDCALVMTSFRLDRDGRLVIGGIGSLEDFGAQSHRAWTRRMTETLFPHLEDVAFEHAWCGRIAMTGDHLPKIVRFGPNAYQIFGYSGRGIGPGTVMGRAVAQALAEGDESALPLSPQPAHAEQFAAAKRYYYECGATLTHLAARRRAPPRAALKHAAK